MIYRMLFCVNIYGSYKLLKTVQFFGPPCTLLKAWLCVFSELYVKFVVFLKVSFLSETLCRFLRFINLV